MLALGGYRVDRVCFVIVGRGGQALCFSFLPVNVGCWDIAIAPKHLVFTLLSALINGLCIKYADHSGRTVPGFKKPKLCLIILPFPLSCRECFTALVFDPLSFSTSLSHAIGPPSDALMHRSLRCASLQVGYYLLDCSCPACINFKVWDQPCFWHHSSRIICFWNLLNMNLMYLF